MMMSERGLKRQEFYKVQTLKNKLVWIGRLEVKNYLPPITLQFNLQKLTNKGLSDLNWLREDINEKADLHELRQRLELTSLAIETGAPLTTAEVSKLLGVKPLSDKYERGGLTAKKLSRNVWKLTKSEKDNSHWRN